MYQVDQKFQIEAPTLKICLHFQTTICDHMLGRLNLTLRTLMIFRIRSKTQKVCQIGRRSVPWMLLVFTLIYRIGESLAFLHKLLQTIDNKQISSDTLTELAEVVLQKNIFEFNEKRYKQKRGTKIGTKFAPPWNVGKF